MVRILGSLRVRLLVVGVALLATLAGVVVANDRRLITSALEETTATRVREAATILHLSLAPLASSGQYALLGEFLDELLAQPGNLGLTYLVMVDDTGRAVVRAGRVPDALPPADGEAGVASAIARGVVHHREALLLSGNSVGFMQFGLSTAGLQQALQRTLRDAVLLVLAVVALAGGVLFVFGLRLSRQVERLVAAGEAITSGHYELHVAEEGGTEMRLLARHFNRMAAAISQRIDALEASRSEVLELNRTLEARVEARTRELTTLNATLSDTIRHLEQTRESLVRSERLAGLGALVAGVAHELNTPIGNALTAASGLGERAQDLARDIAAGNLRKSVLQDYLDIAHETADLVVRNLDQAATLVSSFKHVAVDQTSEQRRRFDLHQSLEEVVRTLAPTLKKSTHTLRLDVPDGLEMDSFPGALGQIINNLVSNALVHAFDGRAGGQMTLSAEAHGPDQVRLHFADDGCGIPPDVLTRIFDPFFSTRFGQGGSGLGLSICHNVVEGVLGGHIGAASTPGSGTVFTIEIPTRAPDKKAGRSAS